MKNFFILLITLVLNFSMFAQQFTHSATLGDNPNIYPFTSGMGKMQCLYPASKFSNAPTGNITTIYLRGRVNGSATGAGTMVLGDLNIKIGTTALNQFSNQTDPFITGLTSAYNNTSTSLNVTTGQWIAIPLSTPIPYTSGSNIILEISKISRTGDNFEVYNTLESFGCKLINNVSNTSTNGVVIGTGVNFTRLIEFGFDVTPTAPVGITSVDVLTQGNVPSIITTNGGTLQMVANVLPSTSNQSVNWSITPGTGTATISAAGLVTAQSNGTVWAKAVSVQDTTKSDSLQITISNQGGLNISDLQLSTDKLKLYPNPANNMLYLENKSLYTIKQITIFDASGKKVFIGSKAQNHSEINISSFASGIYNVKIAFEEGEVNRKLIVVK